MKKAEMVAALEAAGIEVDAKMLKPELEVIYAEVFGDDESEIDRRRREAAKCIQCGRSRLDGHIHGGA